MAYTKITGIYAIRHEPTNSVYYGSAVCIKGRIAMHRRELRNGIHPNVFLQGMWNKYGEEMKFEIVEECDRGILRQTEQKYINAATGRLMNLAKEVCELASRETHAERMRNAWKKRTPEALAAMKSKIAETLKKRYSEDPNYADSARSALKTARAARKARPTSPEERERRAEGARRMWVRRKAKSLMI